MHQEVEVLTSPLFLDFDPKRSCHRVGINGNFDHFDAAAALTTAILNEAKKHGRVEIRGNEYFKDNLLKSAIDFNLFLGPVCWTCFPGQSGSRLMIFAYWQPENDRFGKRAGIIYKNNALTLAKGASCLMKVPEARNFIIAANRLLTPGRA